MNDVAALEATGSKHRRTKWDWWWEQSAGWQTQSEMSLQAKQAQWERREETVLEFKDELVLLDTSSLQAHVQLSWAHAGSVPPEADSSKTTHYQSTIWKVPSWTRFPAHSYEPPYQNELVQFPLAFGSGLCVWEQHFLTTSLYEVTKEMNVCQSRSNITDRCLLALKLRLHRAHRKIFVEIARQAARVEIIENFKQIHV